MKEVNAFQLNFNEFSNKLVAAFTTNGVENLLSLPHILLFALDAKKILLLHFQCPLRCSDV